MDKEQKKKLKNALQCLQEDFTYLIDGVEFDPSQFEASLENVELIAKELNIKLDCN